MKKFRLHAATPKPDSARPALTRSAPAPLALEPRLVFDGDVAKGTEHLAVTVFDNARTDEPRVSVCESPGLMDRTVELPAPAAASPREIAFVDTSVADWQTLVAGIKTGTEVILLDPARDGFAQIQAALSGVTNISALHIISHGSEGTLSLGATNYTAENLGAQDAVLSAIGQSLTADGDILLYGCDIAGTDAGLTFIGRLAEKTGADVAASTDLTGTAAVGGNWTLERSTGAIESERLLTDAGIAAYDNWLSALPLDGNSGWTAIMFGTNQDPVGDSQAGAADTDIVGDANHGSLYTAYETNGTASTADDMLAFRLRIDNPTSVTNFTGVAIVGLDANGDGRIDLFISVDGRNNTQAVRLLDPGTGANISPSTTSTSALPTGWLPNNGVYAFTATNYSVVAVSAASDPHWNGDADLGNDGKTDVFVSWRVPVADIAAVLAKASPVDRNGVYGPRGSTGIAGFNKDTVVSYVSFTQTQPGPINGDLNGVGASYDKNASFAALGAFTAPMTASSPVTAGPRVSIDAPISGGILNDAEDNAVTISGTSENVANKSLQLSVTDGTHTVTGSTTVNNDGTWTVTGLNLSALDAGTLTVSATVDPDADAGTANSVTATASVLHDATPPVIAIDQLASTTSGRPTFTGTSDLADGSLILITIDADNNALTTNLVYQVLVSGGTWALNTATVAPVSGAMPVAGLTTYAKVTATATDAAGNTATAVALNRPTVATLSTNVTTPVLSGTWTNISGDVLTVTINGATYTLAPSGNTWSLNLASATPTSGALGALVAGNSYEVTVTTTRSGVAVGDGTTSELAITNTPVIAIDIAGGASIGGTDTTPVITGTSANAGGFVIVRLDPNNDGDLSDAVTYSVTPDGSGNWSLDTGVAVPISGVRPAAGFIGAIGIRATDSTGAVADVQVLTITTPTIAITGITSTATTNATAVVDNSGAAANYLNMREDDAVTIAGTATTGTTVDLLIRDASGNVLEYTGVAVDGSGNWSVTNKDLSSLDNGTLTVTATLSGTAISAVNSAVTHDKAPPIIYITAPDPIKKSAAEITGRTDLTVGTLLTVQIYDGATLKAQWTNIAVGSGGFFTTSGVSPGTGSVNIGNGGPFTVNVFSTSTSTDAAKNITQTATKVISGSANASTATIAIGTIAGDNQIVVAEIASGVTIAGTTSLAGAGTATVVVTDGTTTITKSSVAYASGAWSTTLTTAEIQTLKNGQLTVTASVVDSSVSISDVAFATLSLATPALTITDNTSGSASGPVTFTFTFTEAVTGFTVGDIVVTNGTKGAFSGSGTTYTLVVTPASDSSGDITVSVANSAAAGVSTGRASGGDTATQAFNTTAAAAAPTLTIDTSALASDTTPLISGTTSLPAGAPIVITIDTNNDGVTDLTYSATVQSGGTWSVNLDTTVPTAGTLAADGLAPSAKITATATNAYGNSTSATGLNTPTVSTQLTNDNTPTITGAWTQVAGDTLAIVVNGVTYSVANGNLNVTATGWSLTPVVALADNTYSVSATVTRATGGSATDLTSSEIVIDTLGTVTISGGSSTDLTGSATPVIAGTSAGLPAGTVLTLSLDTDNDGHVDLTYQTTVAGDGTWSVNTATATPASGVFPSGGLTGPIGLSATATDAAGNTGLDTQLLTVDRVAPTIALTFGAKTSDNTPLITGTTDLPPGSTVTVEIDPNNDGDWSDKQTYVATVQTGGTWSVEATTPLSGTVGVRASGTDAVGNATLTGAKPLQIVLNAPTIELTSPLPTVGGDNVADATEDDAIVLLGTTTNIAAGSTVVVTVTDGTLTITDTAVVQNDGTWSLAALNLSAMANGTLVVTATANDVDGSAYTSATSFVHDKSATVAIDSISEDTGVLADFITKDSTIVITGSATANAAVTVVVKDASNVTVATFNVTASNSGVWSTAATGALAAGNYTIAATVGGTTVTHALTIVDATAPILTSSTPLDNAINVAVGSNLTLTFSKTIQAGSGFISLYRADGTLIENFNVATGTGDQGGTISFSGSGVSFNPAADLVGGTGYYVKVDASAVTDSVGNAFAGISDAATLNFTAQGAGDVTPPVITGPSGNAGDTTSAKTINENNTAVATFTADEAVTWSLVGGTDQGRFTINPTTGALSFNSAPDYEAPTDSDGNNTYVVQIRAVDANGNASVQTITVTVANVDEVAPVITGPSGNAGDATSAKTINENNTAVATFTADEAVTWSLVGGTDQGRFTINTTTGALSFNSAPDYEAPTDSDGNNAYVVQIRAVDANGNASVQTITVTVANVDEVAPAITGPGGNAGDTTSAKTINENNTAVATFTADEAVTWSLVGGTDQGRFTINATTGALSFNSAPDYEAPTDSDGNNTYVVQIRAVDANGNASVQTITITVANVDEAAPVITGPSGNAGDTTSAKTINENSTAVATFTADEAVTWSLVGGTDQGRFTINTTTGALSFNSAPDYEAPTDSDGNNTYVVQIRAVDANGNASVQTITITVANVDEAAPVITGPSGNAGDTTSAKTINENSTAVATFTADETVTWSLVGGTDQGRFTINTTTGALSFNSAPDYEAPTDSDGNNTYVVQIRAVDANGNASVQTITVTVANVDEVAPVISGPSGNAGDTTSAKTINENSTAVATFTADEAVTWSLVGGTDQGRFTINATTGALSFNSAPDYEAPTDSDGNNTYVVQIRAVDANGNASVQTITVTVANVDEVAPVITGPSGNAGDATSTVSISENTTAVAMLTANEAVVWTLVGGADQSKFTIDATTGVLRLNTAPDYEAPTDVGANNTYVVQVRATDNSGNVSTQTITVTVTDVDEAGPTITGPSGSAGAATSARTVAENTTAVGTFVADRAVTWSLVGGADAAKFSIDATTGVLRFAAAPDFEAPTDSDLNNTYVVQVRAIDGGGHESIQTLTVTVADVDEAAPVITGPSGAPGASTAAVTVDEGVTRVTTLTANEPVTWSLTGGTDQARFTIDAATGVLTFLAAPDYESPGDTDVNNTYVVEIRAVDAAGNSAVQTLVVTVANVNEAPTAPVLPAVNVMVGSPLEPLPLPEFSDREGSPLTYSVTLADGSSLPAWLTFNPVTRVLSGTPPAGTVPGAIVLRVTASDGQLSASANLSVTVVLPSGPSVRPDAGTAVEASGVGNEVPGTNPVGNVLANDAGSALRVTEVQFGGARSPVTASATGTSLSGAYGTLRIAADGTYAYQVDDANLRVEALNTGDVLTETFTYRVTDQAGQTSEATLTITIQGRTDAVPPVPDPVVAPVAPLAPSVPVVPVVESVLPVDRPLSVVTLVPVEVERAVGTGFKLGREPEPPPPPAPRETGYAVTVLPADAAQLRVYRGVPDQFSEPSALIHFMIPSDAFAHTRQGAVVVLHATLMDGSALPSWLIFDRMTGTFDGIPPKGFIGELRIKVTARDAQGLQAETVFRFSVGEVVKQPQARAGFTRQIRGLAYLNSRTGGGPLVRR